MKLYRAIALVLSLASLLPASLSGQSRAVSAQSSAELVIQNGHSSGVISASFSPDGKYLATVGEAEAKIWRASDGTLLRTFLVGDSPDSALVTKDDSLVLIGPLGPERLTKLYGLADGKEKGSFPYLERCSLSPDGRLAAGIVFMVAGFGKRSYELQVRSLATGELVASKEIGDRGEGSVDFSPDGASLLALLASGDLKLYDTKTWKERLSLAQAGLGAEFGPPLAFFGADSRSLSALDWDKKAVLTFDSKTGAKIGTAPLPAGGFVLDRSSRRLVEQVAGLDAPKGSTLETAYGDLAALSLADKSLSVHSLSARVERYRLTGHSRQPTALAIPLSGKSLETVSSDGRLRYWDAATGTLAASYGGAGTLLALSADGVWLATATKSSNPYGPKSGLRLWRYGSPSPEREVKTETSCPSAIAYAPGSNAGVLIGTFERADLSLLDAAKGRPLATSAVDTKGYAETVVDIDSSPDGKVIAVARSKHVDTYAAADLAHIRSFDPPIALTSVAFGPDGKTIAVGTPADGIYIYDAAVSASRRTLSWPSRDSVEKLDFSPDGKLLAAACYDGRVRLWNVGDWTPAGEYALHNGAILDLRFTPDGARLATASSDATVKLLDLRTKATLTLIAFDDRDWFVYDDAGRFDCSDGGRAFVRFVRGLEAFEPDQFWDSYFTPGLLASFMGGPERPSVATSTAPGAAAPTAKIGEAAGALPSVRILSPKDGSQAGGETVDVVIESRPGSNGLGRSFLILNGKPVDESTRGISVSGKDASRTFTVRLAQGENQLRAAAYDRDERLYGQSAEIRIVRKSDAADRPDLYILSVGVGAYRDPNIPKLKAPIDDAAVVAKAIGSLGEGLYGKVYATVLADKDASARGIMKAFNDLLSRVKSVDTLILFMAGHGITENGSYYFLPCDTALDDIAGTGLSTGDLGDFLHGLGCQKIAVLLDTCQSGAAINALGSSLMTRGLESRKAIVDLAKRRGIIIFAAASATQAANETSELGHGFFTYCLLKALERRSEISQGEVVSMTKLVGTAEDLTRELAQKYNTVQSPVKWIQGEDFGLGPATPAH